MMAHKLLALIVLCLGVSVTAFPGGAPMKVCGTMTPGHGVESMIANPYTLDIGNVTKYQTGTPITVTVKGGAFQGILIQVRKKGSTDTTAIGTFTAPAGNSNLKLLTCGQSGSAVTHSSTTGKTDAQLMWNPPSQDMGELEFIATVNTAKTVWWKNTKSASFTFMATTGAAVSVTGYLTTCLMLVLAAVCL